MGLGMVEILLILVVALVVIGPDKLPVLAFKLGKGWGEFRKTFDDMKDSIAGDVRRSAFEKHIPSPNQRPEDSAQRDPYLEEEKPVEETSEEEGGEGENTVD